MMKNKPNEEKILQIYIINEKPLVCRWLLSHCYFDEDCLSRCLLQSYETGNKEVISTLSWHVTRLFYKQNKLILDKYALDIYPAYKCTCDGKDDITAVLCLQQSAKLIVVELHTFSINLPKYFLHFKVAIFCNDFVSNNPAGFEAKLIHENIRKRCGNDSFYISMPKINGTTASDLYKKHRNLSLICPCPFKSKEFPTSQVLEDTECVQFYCTRKGVIPLGEGHFPLSLEGILTDVLEGHSCFASLPLRVGDTIGTERSDGTFGWILFIL